MNVRTGLHSRVATLIIPVLVIMVVAGCSSGSAPPPAGQPSPSVTPSACPGTHQASRIRTWPRPVPADLPRPPGSNRPHVAFASATITVVQFTSAVSLREGVLFLLGEYPKAGFTLGRGDAEFNQADAPFTRSGLFGQVRINGTGQCATTWLVAIGAAQNSSGTSPLLPAPSVSPSALPFGP